MMEKLMQLNQEDRDRGCYKSSIYIEEISGSLHSSTSGHCVVSQKSA